MAQVKRGKRKFAQRSVRGVNSARRLARKAQNRAQNALGQVLAGGYNTNDLLDDVMEGASDVLDLFRGPSGASGGLPTVTFVTTGNPPPVPARDLVDLAESVQAGLIEKTDLAALALVPQPPPAPPAVTPTLYPSANYRLRLADVPNAVINAGNTEEVDEVYVEFTAVPAEVGIYRGFLTLQSLTVLAEVILIVK